MDKLRAGECKYDFIEVMACPGGCLGGGGQPIGTTMEVNKKTYGIHLSDRIKY